MAVKVKIRSVSRFSFILTIIIVLICIVVAVSGFTQYRVLCSAMQDYVSCENAAGELQTGSDILTKQVRLAASTGDSKYIDAYFKEANVTKHRENSIKDIASLGGSEESVNLLKDAMAASVDLMQTEYYAMRLVQESNGSSPKRWPEELQNIKLSKKDSRLSPEAKLAKAQYLVTSIEYDNAKDTIKSDINAATDAMLNQISQRENAASERFTRIFTLIIVCILIVSAIIIFICLLMKYWIVCPLDTFDLDIRNDAPLTVKGANELQSLARTYNALYQENKERQLLIKHQAEHDPLTDILNRGSFDRILNLYDKGENSFALILTDIDIFKSVNDTYGHACGDAVLKRVSELLVKAFRNVDYVCRIGGDEFAIIMVDMTSDLSYTINDKINEINSQLAEPLDGMPVVSLSAGVAFTDRKDPGESLFKDADAALYYTKEHGRHGCSFHPVK